MGNSVLKMPTLEIQTGDLTTTDGRSRARLTDDGRGIEVSSTTASGAVLVFRVGGDAGQVTLEVPEGDLKLSAPQGRVVLEGQEVSIEAKGDLIQKARKLRTSIAESWQVQAKSIAASADDVTWSADVWRLNANWLRQHVGNALLMVDNTLEERAKRVLVRASSLYRVLSGRTSMRSKDNTSIDGKRVLLG